MKKLAIIVTHPIQYYVPLYELLAKSCNLNVFYTWGKDGAKEKYDHDFKQAIAWDLPLLNGYAHEFLENTAKDPGSHHFRGIVNTTLVDKINEFNPDAILVYGWAYLTHLKILHHFKDKVPIWFRGDSTLLDGQDGCKKVLRGLFLKWVYQHINKAFYVGTANKAYFKKFGLKEHQLIFAPHAVDNIRFQQDRKAEADALRLKLNIASDDILILFAGKLEAKKNPGLLLEAFLEIMKESEVSSQKYKEELEVGSPMSEDWVVKENALRQAQGDKLEETNSEVGSRNPDDKMLEVGSPRSEERELESRSQKSKDWVVEESAHQQAQGDSTSTNKEQGATSNKQRMMSEDRSQKELEVGIPRSEDWVGEESALRKAQGDSTTMNKEQVATTSNKQRMMSEDRRQRSEAIFHKEKRKTKNEKRPHVHLLFVGNGVLEESFKARVQELAVRAEWLEENESDVRCQKSEEQLVNNDASSKQNTHLKSQISNLKSNNIHFMDFQNQTQMPVIYQACDLFCLPSQSETWGLAVNEAMACNKAILVSDKVGCATDLVEPGKNGYIFESNNIESLKTHLRLILGDKSILDEMGQQSSLYINDWSIEKQCMAILYELEK